MIIGLLFSFINKIIEILGFVLSGIINLLPKSPFQSILETINVNSVMSQYLSSLNWIIPVTEIMAILQAWTIAIAVFYIYAVILRWIKIL